VTDASKVALVHAVGLLRARKTQIIDCQVASAHTRSLGAVDMPRAEFLSLVTELTAETAGLETWRSA
jgi:leucyl/phenylalanyl-tRNA--protein transferase